MAVHDTASLSFKDQTTPSNVEKPKNAPISGLTIRRHGSLRGVDALWLLLERATAFNPVCTSTYTFDREVNVEELRDSFRKQCEVFPKYRQRLAFKRSLFQSPYYEDDPEFDLNKHFHVVQLPSPAGPKELNDFVSTWISKNWDETAALWEAAYLPNYRNGQAKGAMISRGHHTQADGQGFIMSALYMTTYGKDLEKTIDGGAFKLHDARTGRLPPHEISPSLRRLDPLWYKPTSRPFVQVGMFAAYWAYSTLDAIERIVYSAVHLVYTMFFLLSTLWRMETVVPVKQGQREAVFSLSKPFKLSEVKTIQRAFSGNQPGQSQRGWLAHVTLNDVLCSVCSDVISQAIERKPVVTSWGKLKRSFGSVLAMPVAFFIPISIRAPGQWDMRNLSTGALVYLGHLPQPDPSIPQIHRHIHKSKRSLMVIKRSYLPALAFHILQFIGSFPYVFYPIWSDGMFARGPFPSLKDYIFGTIISSMTAILTNIPPIADTAEPAQLAGGNVLRWTAAPPTGGRGVLAIGVITYADSVQLTCHVDKVPGYEDAAERICQDFERRLRLYHSKAKEALGER